MALKVVVWGTGNVGRPAIRAVVAHRGLELVGVIVADPDKVGVDAGVLAGIGTLGIQATDEVCIAEADDVDAVVYAVNADFRPEASLEEGSERGPSSWGHEQRRGQRGQPLLDPP